MCSVLGRTYRNECLLHKEACRKRRRTGLAHTGPCLVPKAKCTEEELSQFPYRLLDWFLLLSRMGKSYSPAAPPQSCLSHARRTQLAQFSWQIMESFWTEEEEQLTDPCPEHSEQRMFVPQRKQ